MIPVDYVNESRRWYGRAAWFIAAAVVAWSVFMYCWGARLGVGATIAALATAVLVTAVQLLLRRAHGALEQGQRVGSEP